MKKISLLILIFILTVPAFFSQDYNKNCIYGITFEFSKNPSWGYGELVITDIQPNSAAEEAGIKVGDIIMEINGKATYLRDNQTIAKWLFDEIGPEVRFTVRNVSTYFKEYTIQRKCINPNSISEYNLSHIYSFYSLEDTNHQTFKLPLKLDTKADVNYTDYKSYDFSQNIVDNQKFDDSITTILNQELQRRGMVRDTVDPDIIIQPFYSYYPNAQYNPSDTNNLTSETWRFDTRKQKMMKLPIISFNNQSDNTRFPYIAEFGITFYDRKYIDSTKMTQIWECSIKDFVSNDLSLKEYIAINCPLILKQYPYNTAKNEYIYDVQTCNYNYTGIYFDSKNLAIIRDVDPESPAYKAGLREGYIIKKINGRKFEYTWDSLSEGYRAFINETMKYRDTSTRFTNSEGYTDCMFWRKDCYKQVAKEMDKAEYQALFSYLYSFRPYVSEKNNGDIIFEVWDGVQLRIITVKPEVKRSVIVKAL